MSGKIYDPQPAQPPLKSLGSGAGLYYNNTTSGWWPLAPYFVLGRLACKNNHFSLICSLSLGMFHEDLRLRLSDRNSILMMLNLSRIQSELLLKLVNGASYCL